MRRRWAALGLACAALLAPGCRPPRLIPRATPIPASPARVPNAEGLLVFVAENTGAPLAEDDHAPAGQAEKLAAVTDERRDRYAHALRKALAEALGAAGVKATLDPWAGAELVATATSEVRPELAWDQGGVSISTRTTLVLGTPRGRPLVTAQVTVPASDEDVLDTQGALDRRLDGHARRVAAKLVDALAASPELATYLQGRHTKLSIQALLKQEEARAAAGAGEARATTDLRAAREAAGAFVAGAARPSAHGLAIGVEKYADGKLGSPGARSDATRFAGLMMRTLGVPEENVHLAVDESARHVELERELAWLASAAKGEGRLFLFYSGALALDPRTGLASLVPHDRDSAGLKVETLLRKLGEGGAEVLVVLDACPPGRAKAKELKLPPRVLLAASPREACAQGELALHVTEGLGRGQADADGDRAVTYDELRDFVRKRMAKDGAKEGAQDPRFETGKSATGAQFTIVEGLEKK